jgi:hypothetical protein
MEARTAEDRTQDRVSRPSFARRLATETKQAFKTTEFWAFVAVLIALFIAGNSIEREEGGTDVLDAGKVWLYATLLTIGYMISRGLAKSGSRDPYWAERGDRNLDH